MKSTRLPWIVLCAACLTSSSTPAQQTPQEVIGRLESAWNRLQTYTCTWYVHEAKNNKTQNRVYHIFFQKPLMTRAEVVAGDDKGSVAIWEGGDRVRGHEGGILSFVKLNVDIHNRLATSLRGATIDEVNIGWLVQHARELDPATMKVTLQGANSVVTAQVHYPPPDADVVKEVDVFQPNGLPLEGSQFDANGTLLKHVLYSDYKLNVQLPPSTWQI